MKQIVTSCARVLQSVRLKQFIKAVLPPIITDRLKRRARPAPVDVEWEYLPAGWPDSTDWPDGGWNQLTVSETQRAKWKLFCDRVAGVAPLGIAHEATELSNVDDTAHHAVMTFGYVLARAAHMRSELSVLDWGGGSGHFYVLARALMPHLSLDYHCKDVPVLCANGSAFLPDVHFHSDDREPLCRTYDLVMASTSLHYSQDWRETLCRLAAACSSYLFITGLPLVDASPSFVVLQRPHRYGYHTEYAGWFLNREEFLSAARHCNLSLEREFLAVHRPLVPGAPEQAEYRGFLFIKSGSAA